MKTLLFIIAALLLPLSLSARIGETPEQCQTRYGKAVSVLKEEKTLVFRKNGLQIACHFHEGKCDMLMFEHTEKNILDVPEPLTDDEVQILLKSNSGDAVWKKSNAISMDENWEVENGQLIASHSTIEHHMVICTREFVQRMSEKEKQKAKDKLKDF